MTEQLEIKTDKGNKAAFIYLLTMLLLAFKDWSSGGAFLFSFPLTNPIVGILSFYLLFLERRLISEYLLFAFWGIMHLLTSPFILEIFISTDHQIELTNSIFPDVMVLLLYAAYIWFAIESIKRFKKCVSKWITIGTIIGFLPLIFIQYDIAYILFYLGLGASHLLERSWKPFDQLIYILAIGKGLEYLSYFFASFFL